MFLDYLLNYCTCTLLLTEKLLYFFELWLPLEFNATPNAATAHLNIIVRTSLN